MQKKPLIKKDVAAGQKKAADLYRGISNLMFDKQLYGQLTTQLKSSDNQAESLTAFIMMVFDKFGQSQKQPVDPEIAISLVFVSIIDLVETLNEGGVVKIEQATQDQVTQQSIQGWLSQNANNYPPEQLEAALAGIQQEIAQGQPQGPQDQPAPEQPPVDPAQAQPPVGAV